MVKLIVGKKGTGKTKHLVDLVHQASDTSKGNVVCIEKGNSLTYDIKPQVRLIRADEFLVDSYPVMAGFVCGIMAGDYDCTDIFVDATLKIVGRDYEKVGEMFDKLAKISADTTITCTISADNSELSDNMKKYIV